MATCLTRQKKITLGEMRASGVRGLLIYCSDYRCSHWTTMSADKWPDDLRCPIWSRDSSARPAASEVPMSAPISIGNKRPGAR